MIVNGFLDYVPYCLHRFFSLAVELWVEDYLGSILLQTSRSEGMPT